jgi:putative phage-type endonuclease
MPLTKEQIQMRKVGGSDVATILGLNPYKSAVELYHEKRGTIEPIDLSDNLPVEAGNVLEDGIAQLAARHMTRLWNKEVKLRRCNLTLIHPEYDWLTVHIDRDVVGEDRGVELKNVGYHAARNWGPAGTDEIPEYYLPQPHTYMLVKDYPVWTTAGYFGGADLRLYEIARDKDWDQIIVERTRTFWFDNVLAGVPPDIDLDSTRAYEIVRRVYPGTDGSVVVASADDEHWRFVCQQATTLMGTYKKTAEIAKAHLAARMGEAAILDFADGTQLVRKLQKRKAYTVEVSEGIQARFKKPKGALIEESTDVAPD